MFLSDTGFYLKTPVHLIGHLRDIAFSFSTFLLNCTGSTFGRHDVSRDFLCGLRLQVPPSDARCAETTPAATDAKLSTVPSAVAIAAAGETDWPAYAAALPSRAAAGRAGESACRFRAQTKARALSPAQTGPHIVLR